MSSAGRTPWTLRRRLTVTMAGLLVVAAALIGVVSVVSLRAFLVDRLDQQITNAVVRSTAAVSNGMENGRPGHHDDGDDDHDDRPNDALLAPGQAAGTLVAIVDPSGQVTAGVLNNRGAVVAVNLEDTNALASVESNSEPETIHVKGAGEYRAVSVAAQDGSSLVIALPMVEVNAAITHCDFDCHGTWCCCRNFGWSGTHSIRTSSTRSRGRHRNTSIRITSR